MTFAEEVQNVQARHNLRDEEIAVALKVSPVQVARWRKGRSQPDRRNRAAWEVFVKELQNGKDGE